MLTTGSLPMPRPWAIEMLSVKMKLLRQAAEGSAWLLDATWLVHCTRARACRAWTAPTFEAQGSLTLSWACLCRVLPRKTSCSLDVCRHVEKKLLRNEKQRANFQGSLSQREANVCPSPCREDEVLARRLLEWSSCTTYPSRLRTGMTVSSQRAGGS